MKVSSESSSTRKLGIRCSGRNGVCGNYASEFLLDRDSFLKPSKQFPSRRISHIQLQSNSPSLRLRRLFTSTYSVPCRQRGVTENRSPNLVTVNRNPSILRFEFSSADRPRSTNLARPMWSVRSVNSCPNLSESLDSNQTGNLRSTLNDRSRSELGALMLSSQIPNGTILQARATS